MPNTHRRSPLSLFVWPILAAAMAFPSAAQAALPAPGSVYHLIYASSNAYRPTNNQGIPPSAGRFGDIATADYQVTFAAFDVGLPGTENWDGISPRYRAVLSISGNNASARLAVDGPVYNLGGGLVASGHAQLFSGALQAAVGYDEMGAAIVSNPHAWTGSTSVGTSSGFSCGSWNNTSSGLGQAGNALESTVLWLNETTLSCNSSARLYGLSEPLTAPLWGDYNGDGAVDTADYTVWRDLLGQPPTAQFAAARAFTAIDGGVGMSNGAVVGSEDYQVWRDWYGATLPATTTIPEPSGTMLLAVTTLAAAHVQRQQRVQ